MKKNIIVVGLNNFNTVTGGALTVFNDFCNTLSSHYNMIGCISSAAKNRPLGLNENVEFANLKYLYPDKDYNQAFNQLMQEKNPALVVFFMAWQYNQIDFTDKFKNVPKILMIHSRPDYYFQKPAFTATTEEKYINTTAQILLPSFYDLLPEFIKRGNVVCIPNGIQTQTTYQTHREHKKIVYLSRIDTYKYHEFLINAFALIAPKYPEWQLDIYGQSEPPEYEEILQKQVSNLNLQKQIHFMGLTKEPQNTLKNYDFCVFPSLFEGWGLGLSDALSVGLPAIGLKWCSGVNELIIDGKNGLLADNDVHDFAQKIEKLICDYDLRKRMSKEAYLSTLQYSKDKVYDKWLEVITAIIEHKEIPHLIYNKSQSAPHLFSLNYIDTISKRISQNIKTYYQNQPAKSKDYKYKYKLFKFIPLLTIQQKGGRKTYTLFGLPIWKIRKMADSITTKYYFCNLPVFKVVNTKIWATHK